MREAREAARLVNVSIAMPKARRSCNNGKGSRCFLQTDDIVGLNRVDFARWGSRRAVDWCDRGEDRVERGHRKEDDMDKSLIFRCSRRSIEE